MGKARNPPVEQHKMAERLLLKALRGSKEGFNTAPAPPAPTTAAPQPAALKSHLEEGSEGKLMGVGIAVLVVYSIIWVFLGTLSAYLSWKSNSLIGWHAAFKAFFALAAFMFPYAYLFAHVVHKLDLVMFIQRMAAPASTPA